MTTKRRTERLGLERVPSDFSLSAEAAGIEYALKLKSLLPDDKSWDSRVVHEETIDYLGQGETGNVVLFTLSRCKASRVDGERCSLAVSRINTSGLCRVHGRV